MYEVSSINLLFSLCVSFLDAYQIFSSTSNCTVHVPVARPMYVLVVVLLTINSAAVKITFIFCNIMTSVCAYHDFMSDFIYKSMNTQLFPYSPVDHII